MAASPGSFVSGPSLVQLHRAVWLWVPLHEVLWQASPPPCPAAGILLASFGAGWQLTLHQVPPAPDMATSPLQSFLMVAQRAASSLLGDAAQAAEEADGLMEDVPADDAGGSGGRGAAQVCVTFGAAPKAVNLEQVEDVLKVRHQTGMVSYMCIPARPGARRWCLVLWTAQQTALRPSQGLHMDAVSHLPAHQ